MAVGEHNPSDTMRRRLCYVAVVIALIVFGLLFLRLTPYFWAQLALSASALGAVALLMERGHMLSALKDNGGHGIVRTVLLGLVSAAVLYLVFLLGNVATRALFSFGGTQIDAVYGFGRAQTYITIINCDSQRTDSTAS